MAFIFEMEYAASHGYIRNFMESLAQEEGISVSLLQKGGVLTLVADENDSKLAPFLDKLGSSLPASIFMGSSSHRIVDRAFQKIETKKTSLLPHSIGLCTRCMTEIFDPSSRRYYYPFTSCNCCGAHYPFFERYPFERDNSHMRFFTPCKECEKETASNPFRREFPLVSCHSCGVPVRMESGGKRRYANDSGSFKTMFEVMAKAIGSGKSVRIKTLFGHRLFYDASKVDRPSQKVMLMLDASKLQHRCAVIKDEVHALLSIERPMIHAAIGDESLFEIYGRTTLLKYPDEGFTILLAKELTSLGFDHIAYEMCDEETAADIVVDFDLAVEPQRESRLFINKSVRFFVEGERGIFPLRLDRESDRIVVAHGMAAIPDNDGVTVDRMEKFESAEASALYILEGEDFASEHSNSIRFSQETASVLSVLVEHGKERESAVGVYFGKEPAFIYHNGKTPIVAVPPMDFSGTDLKSAITDLREGSDRLVKNFEERFPHLAERLFGEEIEDIFEAAAIIMDLPGDGFDSVGMEAMKFSGKGGLQIDTKVVKNRFDPYAFIASLMSYRLAGVDNVLLSFSIFESFGDYISDIAVELKSRAKAEHIVLCGKAFANPSLFSRIQKNIGNHSLLMNRVLPIDRENALVGALGI